VAVPEILSFREFRAGLAGVLDRVRRSPDAAVFVGAHRRAEAVLMSVEQYEALQEAAERQQAVAAALASVRAEGAGTQRRGLALFAEVAAGQLSTDELRERVLSRYQVSSAAGDPYLDPASGVLRNLLGITDAAKLARAEAALSASRLIDLERRLPGRYDLAHLQTFHRYILGDVYDWAGQLRTVSIAKGSVFCCCSTWSPTRRRCSADWPYGYRCRVLAGQGRWRLSLTPAG
jgi:PHD/YefM family antitoxin component YafN of YafNO toxin-antitoxin module